MLKQNKNFGQMKKSANYAIHARQWTQTHKRPVKSYAKQLTLQSHMNETKEKVILIDIYILGTTPTNLLSNM